MERQGPSSKAARAAATAWSTFSGVASCTEAILASVAGLKVSKVFPEVELTNFPSIRSWV